MSEPLLAYSYGDNVTVKGLEDQGVGVVVGLVVKFAGNTVFAKHSEVTSHGSNRILVEEVMPHDDLDKLITECLSLGLHLELKDRVETLTKKVLALASYSGTNKGLLEALTKRSAELQTNHKTTQGLLNTLIEKTTPPKD